MGSLLFHSHSHFTTLTLLVNSENIYEDVWTIHGLLLDDPSDLSTFSNCFFPLQYI